MKRFHRPICTPVSHDSAQIAKISTNCPQTAIPSGFGCVAQGLIIQKKFNQPETAVSSAIY
jgi:hypothetical protein